MNAMIMTAVTALGILGIFGAVQSDPKKLTDDCCAKPASSCCTPKPENCCEKKRNGQTEKKAPGDCHGASKDQSSREHDGHRGMCGEKAGGSGCMK